MYLPVPAGKAWQGILSEELRNGYVKHAVKTLPLTPQSGSDKITRNTMAIRTKDIVAVEMKR